MSEFTGHRFAVLLFVALLVATAISSLQADEINPAAPGFDHEGSHAEAIAIADQVMEKMGGRQAWDDTRHLRWRFFGRRFHVWDKHTGDLRIEGVGRDDGEPYVILMNLHSKAGRAWRSGEEIEAGQELTEMLESGEAAWINDSYWMFMPFKLKDSGVTLEDLGTGRMQDGRQARVVQLTFREVGRTPQNKYHVYVAEDSGLVEQWDYFASASDPEPGFQIPWHNWRRYGAILLSDNRGENAHTQLGVFDSLPTSVYTDPSPIDWSAIE